MTPSLATRHPPSFSEPMQTISFYLWLITLLLGPLLLAWTLSRLLKIRPYLIKLAIVFYALAFLVVGPLLVEQRTPRFGIDLKGGTILVYEMDQDKIPTDMSGRELMEKMTAAVVRRVNPTGTDDVIVRAAGPESLEVIVPGTTAQEINNYKNRITNIGNLEFRILANRKNPTLRRWIELTESKSDQPARYPFPSSVLQPVRLRTETGEQRTEERAVASWFRVNTDEAARKNVTETIDGVFNSQNLSTPVDSDSRIALSDLKLSPAFWTELEQAISDPPREFFSIPDDHKTKIEQGTVAGLYHYVKGASTLYLDRDVAWNIDSEQGLMVLVVEPLRDLEVRSQVRYLPVTGEFLNRASQSVDTDGTPAVSFNLDGQGATRFLQLTRAFQPDADGSKSRLAILLNNEIQSAPSLNEPISNNGQISGNFTMKEAEDLIAVLNAGALPAALNPTPVHEFGIGPTFGKDTVDKGRKAITLGMAAVLVFMLIYYWLAGCIADIALVLNLSMTLGLMILIDASLTLPGLAGLVLSVGMSVDANVLIFERLREEQARGSSFRVAIQNGFDRAKRAIVDANVTTLLTALILYQIGTDQVKGFAVTLIIGILMSMYSALFVTRIVFEVAEQKQWVTQFRAVNLIGTPSLDFVGKNLYCAVASIFLIVGGSSLFFYGGVDKNLDIDFTGGTAIGIRFNENSLSTSATLREQLSEVPDLAIEELQFANRPTGERFIIRTSDQDANRVKDVINKAFGDQLVRVHLQEIEPLPQENVTSDSSTELQELQLQTWQLRFDEEVAVTAIDEMFTVILNQSALPNVNPQWQTSGNTDTDSGLSRQLTLTVSPDVTATNIETLLAQLKGQLEEEPIFEQTLNFGSRVASEMQTRALFAIVLSLAGIIAYLTFRFQKLIFGLAAVIALIHDVLISLGMIALSSHFESWGLPIEQFKINLPMIAAFLTLIGYSLNDTIVTFDRLREIRGKSPDINSVMVNLTINQTLSRTVLTSVTTLMVVVVLFVAGGEGVRGFAYCLLVGVVTGTYSSIYIASPALLWMSKLKIFAGSEQRVSTGSRPENRRETR